MPSRPGAGRRSSSATAAADRLDAGGTGRRSPPIPRKPQVELGDLEDRRRTRPAPASTSPHSEDGPVNRSRSSSRSTTSEHRRVDALGAGDLRRRRSCSRARRRRRRARTALRARFPGDDVTQAATTEVLRRARPRRRPPRCTCRRRRLAYEDDLVVHRHRRRRRRRAGRARGGDPDVRRSPARAGRDRRRGHATVQGRGRGARPGRSSGIQVQSDPGRVVHQAEPVRAASSCAWPRPRPCPCRTRSSAFLATALARRGFFVARKPAMAAAAPASAARRGAPAEEVAHDVADGGLVIARPGHGVDAAPRSGRRVLRRRSRHRARPADRASARRLARPRGSRARGPDRRPTAAFAFETARRPASGAPRSSAPGHVTERFGGLDPAPRRAPRRARRSGPGPRARVPALPPRGRADPARAAAVGHLVAAPDRRPRADASARPRRSPISPTSSRRSTSRRALAAETALAQASERVDRAIQERAARR